MKAKLSLLINSIFAVNFESMEKFRNRGILLTSLVAVGIFILSVLPADISGDQPILLFPGMDKLIHAIMYGTLTFFALNEYCHRRKPKLFSFALILLLVWLYSITMELIQYFFINSRSGDVLDTLANLGGIVLVAVIMIATKKIRF